MGGNLGPEDGVIMSGVSVLPLLSTMRGHKKVTVCELGNEPHQTQDLDLGLPQHQSCKKEMSVVSATQ